MYSNSRSRTSNLARGIKYIVIVIILISGMHIVSAREFKAKPFCEYRNVFKHSACMVEHSVQGINYSMANTLSKDDLDIFRTLEVMSVVQNIASSGRYAYLAKTKSQMLSISNPSLMFKRGYGICGNHQDMFLAIMKLLKIPTRSVDFYYISSNGVKSSHAAVEVKIANKWRYLDITNGSIWLKESNNLSSLLSLEEVIHQTGHRLTNINTWYLHYQYPKNVVNPLEYLQGKNLQIIRSKGGHS